MDDYESLNHTKWECKYHVVFMPKCRRKELHQQLRQDLEEVFRRPAQRKESQIPEGHLVVNRTHMLISIPPEYAVAQVIGYIKGKSAIHIAGMIAGVAIGLLCLYTGWMETTEHDNRTLLDLLKGPPNPKTRETAPRPKGGQDPRATIHLSVASPHSVWGLALSAGGG
jgi:putative transposase